MKRSGGWILFALILTLVCVYAGSPTRAQFYCDQTGGGGGPQDPTPPPPPECYSDSYLTYQNQGATPACNPSGETHFAEVWIYETWVLICNGQIVSTTTTLVGTLCCNGAYCGG
jgi:hypothetical protein